MKRGTNHHGDLETSAIPVRLQRRAGRLLAAGATFEETLDALQGRGAEQLTLKAVQNFFRSRPDVQRERVERRREAVEELKQALAGPDCVHRNLAEAALFTGLTELTAPLGLYRSQLDNCRLQIQTQELKCRKATLGQRVACARLKLATARWEMARLRLAELEQELTHQLLQQDLQLPALETFRRIHRLISNPTAAPGDGNDQAPRALEDN
jgi:hypothetical protein